MKTLLIISTFILSSICLGQGYPIEADFSTILVPKFKTNEEANQFWQTARTRMDSIILIDSTDSEAYYQKAIAVHQIFPTDMDEALVLIEHAISLKRRSKYYLVRSIIKYNIGVWDKEIDFKEACPDIKTAIKLGVSSKLLQLESIKGIKKHCSL